MSPDMEIKRIEDYSKIPQSLMATSSHPWEQVYNSLKYSSVKFIILFIPNNVVLENNKEIKKL